MATMTIVVTYSGTLGSSEEVASFTSEGTAFATLTGVELRDTSRIMRKAIKRANASHGQKMQSSGA